MSFIFKMKVLRTSMTPRKTVLCLNVYLPCCSDTLQAPKICAVVHTSLLHKVHIVSVVILYLLRLAGDGRLISWFRLETHLIHNKFINNSKQKGCMEKIPGCWEHLSMVRHALKEARAQNSSCYMVGHCKCLWVHSPQIDCFCFTQIWCLSSVDQTH